MSLRPSSRRVLSVVGLTAAAALSAPGAVLAATSAAPAISSLSATSGPVVGHGKVTVHGSGFTGVTTVLFGGAKGGSVHVVSSGTLTVVVPAHKAARVDVRVVTSHGTSKASKHDVFAYVAAPAVKSVSVASGVLTGGVTVVVKGSGFTHVKKVLFGKAVGTKLHVASGSSLSVIAPAHAAGRVDVRVVSSYGTSSAKVSDRFTFVVPPVVTPDPVITTKALPAAERGEPYSAVVAVTSGTPPFTVTATGLPPGLALSAAGALSGTTFAVAQTYPVTLTVLDAARHSSTASLTLVVGEHGGQVLAWGSNVQGLLGNGAATTTAATAPVAVAGLTDVVQVAGGFYSSYALRADGTVYSWGSNAHDGLGDGTTADHLTPQQIPGLNGVVQVAAADHAGYALKADGTVVGWGDNGSGEVGDGTTTPRTSPVQIVGPTHVVQIAAGTASAYAVQADGQVWSWGDDTSGELGSGSATSAPALIPALTGVRQIAARAFDAFALLSDGTVRGWGYNFDGEVGDTTKTQRSTPVAVYGLTGVIAIADGDLTAYALTADGTVHAWGNNAEGEIGDGTTTTRLSPVATLATGVQSIAAGEHNAFAARPDGSVLVWGEGMLGGNGDGTTSDRTSPEVNASLNGATGIADAFVTEYAIR